MVESLKLFASNKKCFNTFYIIFNLYYLFLLVITWTDIFKARDQPLCRIEDKVSIYWISLLLKQKTIILCQNVVL